MPGRLKNIGGWFQEKLTGKKVPEGDRRVAKWDNARGLLIFLVVLGHVAEPGVNDGGYLKWLFFLIYSFHMPAFFFLSGMVSKSTVKQKRYDRAVGYLFLFFAMKMIVYCTRCIMHHSGFSFHLYVEDGIPWFAFCMFAFLLITILTQNLKRSYIFIGAILLACFAGYDDAVGDTFVLSRIIVYYPAFFAGYCLEGDSLLEKLDIRPLRIAGGVLLFLITIIVYQSCDEVYWLRPLVTGRNPFSRLSRYSAYGGWIRLIYYFMIALIIFSFLAVMPKRKTFLADFGKRSLSVYALHIPLLYITNLFKLKDRFLYRNVFPSHLIPCLIWAALATYLCSRERPYRFCRKIMDVSGKEKSQ